MSVLISGCVKVAILFFLFSSFFFGQAERRSWLLETFSARKEAKSNHSGSVKQAARKSPQSFKNYVRRSAIAFEGRVMPS